MQGVGAEQKRGVQEAWRSPPPPMSCQGWASLVNFGFFTGKIGKLHFSCEVPVSSK